MKQTLMEQIMEQEPMIRRAMEIEQAMMQNENERYLYEMREKGRRDWDNAMITAKKRGRQEAMCEVARAMLIKEMPVEFIQEVTGLSGEEIQSLR